MTIAEKPIPEDNVVDAASDSNAKTDLLWWQLMRDFLDDHVGAVFAVVMILVGVALAAKAPLFSIFD